MSNHPVLVDVGAHHGHVSRTFALKGWRVIAFEPEKQNRLAFLRNTSGFQNVTCYDKAVSDKSNEKVPFYVSKEHYGIHSLKPFHKSHELAYEVATIRLDDVLESNGVTNVTFLKIDIEGADFLALKGFDVKKYRPELVMLEFMDTRSHQNFGYTHCDVVSHMDAIGYFALVSEWAPIKEYGREGVSSEPHTWLQCVPYPLDHIPAWGNLIFVPKRYQAKLLQELKTYLDLLDTPIPFFSRLGQVKKSVGRIPGARWLYRKLRGQ